MTGAKGSTGWGVTAVSGSRRGVPSSVARLGALPARDAPRADDAGPAWGGRGGPLGDGAASRAGSSRVTERLGISRDREWKGATHRRLATSRTPAVTARVRRRRETGGPPVDAARTRRTSLAVIGCCCAQHPACKTSVHRRFRTRATPWAVADQGLKGFRRKERPSRQGHLRHVLADICQALGRGEGLERGVEPEALRHLVVMPLLQVVLECWLADQHNLEWERAGCKRVCQLPHLLEGLEGQVLRLINDESHIPAPMRLLHEARLYLGLQGAQIIRRHRHGKTAREVGEDIHEKKGAPARAPMW